MSFLKGQFSTKCLSAGGGGVKFLVLGKASDFYPKGAGRSKVKVIFFEKPVKLLFDTAPGQKNVFKKGVNLR